MQLGATAHQLFLVAHELLCTRPIANNAAADTRRPWGRTNLPPTAPMRGSDPTVATQKVRPGRLHRAVHEQHGSCANTVGARSTSSFGCEPPGRLHTDEVANLARIIRRACIQRNQLARVIMTGAQWLNRCRRLAKDFENLSPNASAFLASRINPLDATKAGDCLWDVDSAIGPTGFRPLRGSWDAPFAQAACFMLCSAWCEQALRWRDPNTGKALRRRVQWKRENTSQRGQSRQYWQSDAALNAIDCFTPVCAGRHATKHSWLSQRVAPTMSCGRGVDLSISTSLIRQVVARHGGSQHASTPLIWCKWST